MKVEDDDDVLRKRGWIWGGCDGLRGRKRDLIMGERRKLIGGREGISC